MRPSPGCKAGRAARLAGAAPRPALPWADRGAGMNDSPRADRLIAIFMLGALLISPPLLAIFRADFRPAGIPLLFVYLFAAWAALILLGMLAIALPPRA